MTAPEKAIRGALRLTAAGHRAAASPYPMRGPTRSAEVVWVPILRLPFRDDARDRYVLRVNISFDGTTGAAS